MIISYIFLFFNQDDFGHFLLRGGDVFNTINLIVHQDKDALCYHLIYYKTHHYIIFFVRPLHSKPGMES